MSKFVCFVEYCQKIMIDYLTEIHTVGDLDILIPNL